MALCVFTGLGNIWYSEENIQAAKQEFSKNLVSYYVWLYFVLWYGSLKIFFVTQAFVLWCRSLRSLFHAYTLFCSANGIGYCVTQHKIARIISIVSGVLWWRYATVGTIPDGYVRTNPLPQVPTRQSVPTTRKHIPGYLGLPIGIPTLRSIIAPAIDRVQTPWLSFH